MLPNQVARGINEFFAEDDILDFSIKKVRHAGGGDINEAALLETSEGLLFVKWNSASRFPNMFKREAEGLNKLRSAEEISVPLPLHFDEIDGIGFLLMEAIEQGSKEQGFWFKFGMQLAELHKHSSESFGFNSDNYIGSLVQHNRQSNSWTDFFVEQRLEPQLRWATESNRADKILVSKFHKLFEKLDGYFPKEAPSLLHGDLWNGNFMVNLQGQPVLIDPAVYFGHREMDLAMSRLFGGFSEDFYQGYHQSFPLESGWIERTDLCNLYPLLVHLNLFGSGYFHQIVNIIHRYV
ncbi:MAG: fructosamine kinase family protein [Bacteroidales bacterium]|nr:fructosamine kinase family protein [Bacteroidales bacterium]